MNGVKADPENATKAEPSLDDIPMGGFADDDEYEDTGELTMPREEQEIWLARVPRWVYTALQSRSEADEPHEIAQFDLYEPDMTLPKSERMERGKITFKGDWRIPKQYDVSMTKMDPKNIHIFSEKNLPGYKPNHFKKDNADVGTGGIKDEFGNSQGTTDRDIKFNGAGPSGNRDRISKRGRGYRKAIPKQTALLRTLRREMNCTPVENDEYRHYIRSQEEAARKSKLRVVNEDEEFGGGRELNIGTLIKGTSVTTKRSQENKAARIPENELVTMLFACFKEFKYWGLKNLRTRTKQPEQYLKSVLQTIAELNTSGSFNGTWSLKKENNMDFDELDVSKEEMAPDEGNPTDEEDEDGDDDDDDDGMEMEDVV